MARVEDGLNKEAARAYVLARVTASLTPLLEAQIANAQGIKYLVTRDRTGKFVRVTAAMAGALKDDAIVEVWEKDPSIAAFTDLLNRALDKPAEQEQAVAVAGSLVIRWQSSEPP